MIDGRRLMAANGFVDVVSLPGVPAFSRWLCRGSRVRQAMVGVDLVEEGPPVLLPGPVAGQVQDDSPGSAVQPVPGC